MKSNKIGDTLKMIRKYDKKSIKTNKISVEFSDLNLTNYAGLVPVAEFLFKKLDFFKALKIHLFLPLRNNFTFHNYQIFSTIIFGYLCSYRRIVHFEELSKDRVIQKILGLRKYVDENTIGRRLKQFTFKNSHQLTEVTHFLQRKVHRSAQIFPSQRQIVDIDSSVKGVYGSQEGAAIGYNDKKKGQKSYHPILAFLKSTKECLHSWYRPGNTYTGNGAAEFIKECFERLPGKDYSYLFRADSGFFDDKLLSTVEEYGASYLVKVKLKNLRSLLTKQTWFSIPGLNGIEYCEFFYQCHGWKSPRKFVGLRILKEILREDRLFEEYIYDNHCFVVNFEEAPIEIYQLYRDRAECENWIEAVKQQIGAGFTNVDHFWANDTLWQLGVLAYNITIWMRYLTCSEGDPRVGKSWRQEPNTFRNWFIHTAGKLVCHAGQYLLKLPKYHPYRKDWWSIYKKVLCLQI